MHRIIVVHLVASILIIMVVVVVRCVVVVVVVGVVVVDVFVVGVGRCRRSLCKLCQVVGPSRPWSSMSTLCFAA